MTLSAGSLAALLTENATSATVPPLLFAQTAKVALLGAASHSITALTEGVLHAMFLSKLKMASAWVLTLAAMGGVGIGAYYLHAQDPTDPPVLPEDIKKALKDLDKSLKRPDEAAADKKALGKAEERLQKRLLARRDMAEEEWKIRSGLWRLGANEPGTGGRPVTLHLVFDAAKRLLKAELELSNNKAERVKAREKYLNGIKEVVDTTEAQYKVSGRVGKAEFASALYEQLDAEIELEREKLRK